MLLTFRKIFRGLWCSVFFFFNHKTWLCKLVLLLRDQSRLDHSLHVVLPRCKGGFCAAGYLKGKQNSLPVLNWASLASQKTRSKRSMEGKGLRILWRLLNVRGCRAIVLIMINSEHALLQCNKPPPCIFFFQVNVFKTNLSLGYANRYWAGI